MRLPATVLVTALVLTLTPSMGLMAVSAAPVDRPNVLLIITDDQRGGTVSQMMPHTFAWFGLPGTRFRHAYTTTPLCCPSRASFLTGLYAHNHGVQSNREDPASLAALEPLMIQRALHDGGYRTGLVGKFLNNWPNDRDPANFDRWTTTPFVSFSGDEWNVDGTPQLVDQNSTSYIGDRSIDFLQEAETMDDVPWFLHVGFMAPHLPAIVESRYRDVPVPPLTPTRAMTEADRSDKPEYVRGQPLRTKTAIEKFRRPQLRSLVAVDDQVNRIMTRLAEMGELDNTLAIFVSDNGYLWGEHGLFQKSAPYMPSVRIPLYLRWPGHVEPGAIDDRMVGGLDLAPTILSAAGLPPLVAPDGMDLLQPNAQRSRLLLEFRKLPNYYVPTWSSLVTRRFQYIEYRSSTGRITFREYYRLWQDPQQLRNLLRDGDPSDDPDLARLSGILARLMSCAGTSCPH